MKIFIERERERSESVYLLAKLLLRGLRDVKPKDARPSEEKSADWESIWKVRVCQSSFCRGVLLEIR